MTRTLAVALATGPEDAATRAVLRLVDAAVRQGHRVVVFAYAAGARVADPDQPTGEEVAALLRRSVPGLHWITEGADHQVPGVLPGDQGDLWRAVLRADVVLGVVP